MFEDILEDQGVSFREVVVGVLKGMRLKIVGWKWIVRGEVQIWDVYFEEDVLLCFDGEYLEELGRVETLIFYHSHSALFNIKRFNEVLEASRKVCPSRQRAIV